jgi:hypothetical protein
MIFGLAAPDVGAECFFCIEGVKTWGYQRSGSPQSGLEEIIGIEGSLTVCLLICSVCRPGILSGA